MLVMRVVLLPTFRLYIAQLISLLGHFCFFLFSILVTKGIVQFQENKEGLELLKTAIAKAGYTDKVSLISYSYYVILTFQILDVLHYIMWQI